jgi:putative chitobiose transport system substrate-binding protein
MKRNPVLFIFSLLAAISVLLSACASPTPAAPAAPETIVKTVQVEVVKTQIVEKQTTVEKLITPTPAPNPEAVIEGVEPNAEITFWTYWLSPTFDDYINSTLARFNEAYPGVKVKWEDHQATFLEDYRNAINAGNAPDVANLSNGEGWVSEFANKGLLMNLDEALPQNLKDLYFPGLWKVSLVDGQNYQFPWYAAVATELINTQVYSNTAGLDWNNFPTKIDELPAICKTIKEKTGTLCDIRLTVNDLPSQMIYEGNVKFMSADGKTYTFDSPEAAKWLQMYVDMVKDGTVDRKILVTDQDREALDLFTSGKAAFFQTGPQLIRVVRENNPGLYGYIAVKPAPVGASGALAPTAMGISVKKDTKYPKAALALAQFFTNPKSQLEFAKVVSIYPSTPASFDDPFFSAKPVAIEDSAKPIARDIIAKQTDLKPTIPNFKDVNDILLNEIQQALFNGKPAEKALADAAAQANALPK